MKDFLSDWRTVLPAAGLGVLAAAGLFFVLRPKKEDPRELERERRAYLNRVGRIVEGQVLEIADHSRPLADASAYGSQPRSDLPSVSAQKESMQPELVPQRQSIVANGAEKLLYYTYSISGVTYETAQDITGLEESAHLSRVAAGQTASVKYDPSNPSNSILLSDEWSGLH